MTLLPSLESIIRAKRPCLWINDAWRPISQAEPAALGWQDVLQAQARWQGFESLLVKLFPELASAAGRIESELRIAPRLQEAMRGRGETAGKWFLKCDHDLPVAGSIKARGGLYEVLLHAESLATTAGLIEAHSDRSLLAGDAARALFAKHSIAVGSTGNLGLSIGIIAAALGFRAIVHMSRDAKPWKKARLRARGVEVVEHTGDFGAAVAAGRAQAESDPSAYFVDDEHSERLFLGYSVAALRLQQQLIASGITIDDSHPLFVYLPCGVGGAPGGITFGLRHLFGDDVHCFLAEPVAAPCMLIRLASNENRPISVQALGLDGRTEADGLAVGRASELAATLIRTQVSGVFTVPDQDLFEDLFVLERTEGIHIEPSAAAGFRGPHWLMASEAGREYLDRHSLRAHLPRATHVLWTTGGAFVPDEEYRRFHERGRLAHAEP